MLGDEINENESKNLALTSNVFGESLLISILKENNTSNTNNKWSFFLTIDK
tara:strand:+ start:145 stop:297 length:153 start_codon:yes stop_codon:yes gene_type:complete